MNSKERGKKHGQEAAKRAARLRRQGLTLSQVAENLGVKKDVIAARIALGERLLSLDTQ